MSKETIKPVLVIGAACVLAFFLAGCVTTAKIQKACGYRPTVAEVNTVIGVLTGPLGALSAEAVNAGEAAGCAALAAKH